MGDGFENGADKKRGKQRQVSSGYYSRKRLGVRELSKRIASEEKGAKVREAEEIEAAREKQLKDERESLIEKYGLRVGSTVQFGEASYVILKFEDNWKILCQKVVRSKHFLTKVIDPRFLDASQFEREPQ